MANDFYTFHYKIYLKDGSEESDENGTLPEYENDEMVKTAKEVAAEIAKETREDDSVDFASFWDDDGNTF